MTKSMNYKELLARMKELQVEMKENLDAISRLGTKVQGKYSELVGDDWREWEERIVEARRLADELEEVANGLMFYTPPSN